MKPVFRPSVLISGDHLGKGILYSLLGGVCWGFSGNCAEFLFADYHVDPRWIVCVRLLGAAVFFMAFAILRERENLKRALSSANGMAHIAGFSIFGVTACQYCYLQAIQASDAGTATVLQSLELVIILAVTCIRTKRLPNHKESIGVALAVVGTFLIATHGSFTSLAISPDGLFWGLLCACTAALYTMLPAKLLHEYGSMTTIGLAMVIGGIVSMPLFRPWEMPVSLDAAGIAALISVVVVGTFLAYLLFLTGVKYVGSMLAGLLACSEPITACILSVVWMGTTFMPVDLVGIAMIIFMMFFVS
ncbi:MAG: EamA family transporter [Coriobacteriales bacterium]|nr:EamA family transporter [Coriobacteriales bacterium]